MNEESLTENDEEKTFSISTILLNQVLLSYTTEYPIKKYTFVHVIS